MSSIHTRPALFWRQAADWRHGRDLEPGEDYTSLQNGAYRSSSTRTRTHRIDASTGWRDEKECGGTPEHAHKQRLGHGRYMDKRPAWCLPKATWLCHSQQDAGVAQMLHGHWWLFAILLPGCFVVLKQRRFFLSGSLRPQVITSLKPPPPLHPLKVPTVSCQLSTMIESSSWFVFVTPAIQCTRVN